MKKLLTVALAASMILAMSVNSFALGNYVLSTDELGTEEETPVEEQTPEVQKPAEEIVPEETDKPNPDTGAEDFVGVAAAAASPHWARKTNSLNSLKELGKIPPAPSFLSSIQCCQGGSSPAGPS